MVVVCMSGTVPYRAFSRYAPFMSYATATLQATIEQPLLPSPPGGEAPCSISTIPDALQYSLRDSSQQLCLSVGKKLLATGQELSASLTRYTRRRNVRAKVGVWSRSTIVTSCTRSSPLLLCDLLMPRQQQPSLYLLSRI